MSLVRLLTTGKSLVGLSDSTTRYRINSGGLLPRFGSPINPFRGKAASSPAPADSPSAGQPLGTPGSRPCPASAIDPSRRGGGWFARWAARLGLWLARPPITQSKPAVPQFAKPTVQSELSLDTIKVVRNDLSDADLEVVSLKAPASPGAGNPEAAEEGWNPMTSRPSGAGNS